MLEVPMIKPTWQKNGKAKSGYRSNFHGVLLAANSSTNVPPLTPPLVMRSLHSQPSGALKLTPKKMSTCSSEPSTRTR